MNFFEKYDSFRNKNEIESIEIMAVCSFQKKIKHLANVLHGCVIISHNIIDVKNHRTQYDKFRDASEDPRCIIPSETS